MSSGIADASRGCLKEEMKMDIISNNLANSGVIGFKKSRISFAESLKKASSANLSENPSMVSVNTDLSQGDIKATGNNLDLAIFGDGFFKVDTPDGIRFTRKGNFILDASMTLITQAGHPVMGKSGSITLYGNEISINKQGVISVDGLPSDQLDVVNFESYENLISEGLGLYRNKQDDQGNVITDETSINQGYLELSNVNVAEEMVNMIQSLRAFESYQKSIKILDQMNGKAINDVGRLR